jgi:hypothetical protein
MNRLVALIVLWSVLHYEQSVSRCIAEDVVAPNRLSSEELAFFETHVRPLLAEHCWKCHDEKKQKGALRLDSREAILVGGESGQSIVPGNVDESLLIQAIRYEGYEMPPDGKLPEAAIKTLETWVARGAPWPSTEQMPPIQSVSKPGFSEEDRNWWAFKPVVEPDVPKMTITGWGRNEVDHFIAAKLETEGLSPAPEADRASLIRRLSFDLIGLPPTPEEVEHFEADSSVDAYEQLVDRLLNSAQYGERWARHWLDLVRYADSDGYRIDHYRPNAWRYRDYVIQSFNDDKPYDRFVQEQIAGDELFPDNPDAITATGYLTHGIYEYNSRDAVGQWDIILNDITDTTGDVFLGMGMQCARCHDHKFDPILQRDYFALRAFFEAISIKTEHVNATSAQREEHARAFKAWEEQTADIRKKLFDLEEPYRVKRRDYAIGIFPPDIQVMMRKPSHERTPREQQLAELSLRQVAFEYAGIDGHFSANDKEEILALRRDLAKFEELKPLPLPTVQAVEDVAAEAPPTMIPKKRTVIPPAFLTVLSNQSIAPEPTESTTTYPRSKTTTGRRSELASWLTAPTNPLSTRVIVNRIWQYHFGRGLAANGNDFGRLGEEPTHPELLDWLTARFLKDGWKLKPLHRLIVLSSTYRQSSKHPSFESFTTIDPSNRWYWRASTRRLDAEQIRDAILAVTGQLSTKAGGPGVTPDQPRRSIYTRVMRNDRDPLLDVFDLPLFFASTSSRDTTTSPIQSLLLFNSQKMLQYAGKLAEKMRGPLTNQDVDPHLAVSRLWQTITGRRVTDAELSTAMRFMEAQATKYREDDSRQTVEGVATGKMPYRTGQSVDFNESRKHAMQVANDERLNRNEFTIEAYFQVRSIYDSGTVRVIASKWNSNNASPGWSLGVTGKGSRRKPQTLVLQLFGNRPDGSHGEAILFSDQHVELNKPYYVGVSVTPAGANGSTESKGVVTFFLKDISNDDAPMSVASVNHTLIGGFANQLPLSFGRDASKHGGVFDGLIDDIRLSDRALSDAELLLTVEAVNASTVGYWQFEPDPGMFADSTGHGLQIASPESTQLSSDPQAKAFVDLCHVLLNANEFLYVR